MQYPRNPQNQSYSALINSFKRRKRRNQKKYLSLCLGFIAIDWIKTTARIETLMNLCQFFRFGWLVFGLVTQFL